MKKHSFLAWLLALFFTVGAHAQEHHSKADVFLEFDHYQKNMKIGLYIELEKDWHTYWLHPGETGMTPILDIQAPGIQSSKLYASTPIRISTPTAESYAHESEALFYKTISIDPKPTQDVVLEIEAEWLVCKEICIPNAKTFSIELPVKGTNKRRDNIFAQFVFPTSQHNLDSWINPDTKTLHVQGLTPSTTVDVFPLDQDIFDYIRPTTTVHKGQAASFTFNSIAPVPTEMLVVEYDPNKLPTASYWITPEIENRGLATATKQSAPMNLAWVLFLAFVGGILLNLMPCVFPVISIKFFNLTKLQKSQKKELIKGNLLYSLGVVGSFLVLAFSLIFLRSLGQELGWGFQLQSPLSVSLMIFLFYVIGMNFLGLFDISQVPIPSWGRKMMFKSNYVGDFFTGVFTTAVATPCTAPFMAASIGYAMTQSSFVIFLTFLMLGLGLSAPYLLLSVVPGFAKYLPSPGPWMETFKECMALPMFLTCAWLIWVFTQLTSTQHLLYLLLALVFLEFSVRAIKWSKRGNWGLAFFFIAIALAMYPFTNAAQPKATDIQWQPFSPETVQKLADEGRWVFVDFTADWCLTCKANEKITFTSTEVQETIEQINMAMIKADWTKKDPIITRTLQKYDRIGVPFYLLYSPQSDKPQILPTILTPSIFLAAIKDQS